MAWSRTSRTTQTARHELAGTLPYIAPERIRDPHCLDPRSDLYSVGVVAFNLLTGKQPFEGSTSDEITYQVVNSVAPRVARVAQQAIPPELDELVADCLATDPEQRPASADAVIARLDAIRLAEPWDQRAARQWWAANAQRLGAACHDLAPARRDRRPQGQALQRPARVAELRVGLQMKAPDCTRFDRTVAGSRVARRLRFFAAAADRASHRSGAAPGAGR